MRVAIVHSFYGSQQPSGENSVVLDQAEQLAKAGHEVSLLGRHTDDLARRRWYAFGAAATTLTGVGATPEVALQAFAPDVVHLHNSFPNWGTSWLRRWGKRTVLTAHNFRPMCAAATLFRDGHQCTDCVSFPVLPAIRHKCYRGSALWTVPVGIAASPVGSLRKAVERAQRVITLNATAQSMFQQVFDRDVDLLPNFVSAGGMKREPTRGWVYVGRLSEDKGIERLLDLWPNEQTLDIIGDGPLAERVRHKCATLSRAYLIGALPREELLARLGSYRGLVVPSLSSEGLPTVMLEAVARGVPLVLSGRIAASRAFAEAGVAALFDPYDSSEGLAAALHKIAERGSDAREAASALHAREYAPSVWQAGIDRIYGQVVDGVQRGDP